MTVPSTALLSLYRSILCFGAAVSIPLLFDELLPLMVIYLNTGWVWGSLVLRLLVILLVILGTYLLLRRSARFSRVRLTSVALWAAVPGFCISFIRPIYDVDYGTWTDSEQLEDWSCLGAASEGLTQGDTSVLVAFLTTSCSHCRAVVQKMRDNLRAGQTIPVHAFFSEPAPRVEAFLTQNHATAIEQHHLPSKEHFLHCATFTFPSVFLLDSTGATVAHWKGDRISYSVLDYLRYKRP